MIRLSRAVISPCQMHSFWSRKSPIYRPPTIDTSESEIQAEFIFKMVVFLLERKARNVERRRVNCIYLHMRKVSSQGSEHLLSAQVAGYRDTSTHLVH